MSNSFSHRSLPTGTAEAAALMSPATLPRLYSIQDVCRIFNRSARTIRTWRQAGHLASVRIGKAVFFTEEALQNTLASAVSRSDVNQSCNIHCDNS
jgi:hypothetical protein